MATQNLQYFLFDFDSTFIKSEGMEELAEIALTNNPQKDNIIKKIKIITEKGMNGEIPFNESLITRIKLLEADTSHIQQLINNLKKNISKSILHNKKFFVENNNSIFIISGGFKEFIIPVVADFGITADHVFANTFIFNETGKIIGVDEKNPLSENNGKVKLIRSLHLKGESYLIGDGYTDYKVKEAGLVKKFIAFTENVERKIVVENADFAIKSFDEFLLLFRSSYSSIV